MNENPNPSAFRTPRAALNLAKMLAIVLDPRSESPLVLIRFEGDSSNRNEWSCFTMSLDEYQRLLDAFETYHSKF